MAVLSSNSTVWQWVSLDVALRNSSPLYRAALMTVPRRDQGHQGFPHEPLQQHPRVRAINTGRL